jgi:hypothetical protein
MHKDTQQLIKDTQQLIIKDTQLLIKEEAENTRRIIEKIVEILNEMRKK